MRQSPLGAVASNGVAPCISILALSSKRESCRGLRPRECDCTHSHFSDRYEAYPGLPVAAQHPAHRPLHRDESSTIRKALAMTSMAPAGTYSLVFSLASGRSFSAAISSSSRLGFCMGRRLQSLLEFAACQLAFPCTAIAQGIDQRQELIKPGVFERRLGNILVQGSEAVSPHLTFCIRPDRGRLVPSADQFLQRSSGISGGKAARKSPLFWRKGIANSMQQEFEQCGAIQAVL